MADLARVGNLDQGENLQEIVELEEDKKQLIEVNDVLREEIFLL